MHPLPPEGLAASLVQYVIGLGHSSFFEGFGCVCVCVRGGEGDRVF